MIHALVKVKSGLYYQQGKGFIASPKKATKFESYDHAEEEMDTLPRAQIKGVKVVVHPLAPAAELPDPNIIQNADGSSFAIGFLRNKDVAKEGPAIAKSKHGLSPRRFRLREEAIQHGSRFVLLEKHGGFYVTKTQDPVNAYINRANGKTNPEIGKKRTDREAAGVMGTAPVQAAGNVRDAR